MPARQKIASAEELVAASAAVHGEPFTLPNGLTVVLRSLTRGEVREFADLTPDEADVRGLMLGLLEPQLSEEQAREMLADDKTVAVSIPILKRILEVSGVTDTFRPRPENRNGQGA